MNRLWQLKFGALIAALICLAIALAVVFVRTLTASQSVERWNREYSTWHAGQLQTDFARLMEASTRIVSGDPAVDHATIEVRYDVVMSRIAFFAAGLAHERVLHIEDGPETLISLKEAMNRMHPRFEALAPGDSADLTSIRGELDGYTTRLATLSLNLDLYETGGAVTAIEQLRGYFIFGAVLIAGLTLAGVLLVVFLYVEIGVRRKLYDTMLASQEQARTAREREQATIIESARRFHAIAMADPVALLVCSAREHAVAFANPAAVALLGLPKDGPIPAPADDFFVDNGDCAAVFEAGSTGNGAQREGQIRRIDGSVFPATLSARALDYGGVPSFVVRILDLTEKQAAQAEIERQREVIYHREKLGALGSLLAGVAHELNNPLSIVVAQASLLEEVATDPDILGRGRKIRAAADRCARIVKTFLAMARQKPPSRAGIDVNKLMEATLELLAYSLRTAGIELRRELAGTLPPVWGDADQIGQVLTNLIVNAQQAMSNRGGVRRVTVATELEASEPIVRISIADSGPGVPAEIRSRIFEPFFTTKPVGEGTGIGLSVCHGIVTAHGGSIAIEDAAGGGARFVVRLPIGQAVVSEDSRAPRELPLPAPSQHVLIIDDEREVAETLSEILERNGYIIHVADSGEAALQRIAAHSYDVVLCDLRMPDIDGTELYRRLKTLRPALAQRFIVVTGDMLNAAAQSLLETTGVPCLEKPFVPLDVRRQVALALEARGPKATGPMGKGHAAPSAVRL